MPFVLLLALSAVAGPPAPELNASVGFGGWVTPGVWVPLRVDVTTFVPLQGMLAVDVAADVRGSAMTSYRRPIRLGAGTRQHLNLSIIVRDPRRPLSIRLLADGQGVARRQLDVGTARATEGIVLALSEEAAGLEFLAGLAKRLRPAYIREDQLAVRWQDYEGVSLVVIRDLDPRRVLPVQRQALTEWIAQGGQVLVTGGERLAVLQDPWLLPLLPAHPTGTIQTLPANALPGVSTPLAVAVVTAKPGATMRSANGIPVEARWSRGRGVVTVWTFDAYAPAFRASPGREALWAPVLNRPGASAVAVGEFAAMLPPGRPLSGRTQAGIVALSVLYILAVRSVLRRWGNRPGAWMLLAATAAGAGVAMYGFALSARELAVSTAQLSIIEGIPDAAVARVTSYVSVSTPYGGEFSLMTSPGGTVRPLQPEPLVYPTTPIEVGGRAPKRTTEFEVQEMIPWPVAGSLGKNGEADLEVINHTGQVISNPMVFLEGRIYRLPDVRSGLRLTLDPTRWEAIDQRLQAGSDLSGQLRLATLARIQRLRSEGSVARGGAWLLGDVRDDRLGARLPGVPPDAAVSVIIVPLQTR